MRSLRMKMVMIMVILILALMLTTGAFLMSGVGNFYVSQFYEQMEETFTPEFIVQLQRLSEEDNAPAQMKAQFQLHQHRCLRRLCTGRQHLPGFRL